MTIGFSKRIAFSVLLVVLSVSTGMGAMAVQVVNAGGGKVCIPPAPGPLLGFFKIATLRTGAQCISNTVVASSKLVAGKSFTIQVKIAQAGMINGFDINFTYAPSILGLSSSTPADFTGCLFDTPSRLTLTNTNSTTTATVRVAAVLLGISVDATPQSCLFTVGFTVQATGWSEFSINTAETFITNPGIVPYTSFNGIFSNVPADVGIENVTATPLTASLAAPGTNVSITVSIRDFGVSSGTVTVTTKAGLTSIDTRKVSLTAGQLLTLTFKWNTAGVLPGSYLISTTVSALKGEFTLSNNTFNDGTVTVS